MQFAITRRQPRLIRLRPVLIVATAVVVAAGSYIAGALLPRSVAPSAPPASVALPADAPGSTDGPLADVDRAIATWTGNLQRDGADFVAAVNLAELYLARVRITGDASDIARALEAAETALAADPDLTAAILLRGQAHFANHDFAEAATDARAVLDAQPGAPQALAALGDAELELGNYDAARDRYAELAASAAGPAVLARQARLASLTGALDDARSFAAQAADDAAADPDARPETIAWYETLVGALAFQAGDIEGSIAAYHEALSAWEGSAAALAGLARGTAAAGNIESAIELYGQSAAILPRPETLAALGDLQALAGQQSQAERTYAIVAAVAALGPSDRQVALFEANHAGDVEHAVALARRELATRHDVYAHDTLAWALLAAGRFAEADAEITLARAQGTEDALLDYHAGMVAAALGRSNEARALLTAVLDSAPGFDPLQAERARATLSELGPRP